MEEDVMIFTTEKFIAQYDLKNSKILGQQAIEGLDVSSLVYGFNKIAVISGNSIYVTNARLESIITISEKFPIKSAFWNNEDLLIYTTTNHWKYSLMNGETGLLKTLEKPIHLLKKCADNKFLAFND
jgi:coatomer protein complex subunit alpha (xenin)